MMRQKWRALSSSRFVHHMTEHIIDVKNKRLGRIASEIASLLQGKHEVGYNPRLQSANRIIVKNISNITVGGNKATTKVYYRHAGKLGHLKVKKFQDVFAKDPKWVLRHAVNLMLPKNRLRAKRMRMLTFE